MDLLGGNCRHSAVDDQQFACATGHEGLRPAVCGARGGAAQATYGEHGGVRFAEFDPVALADQVERLLDDPADRQRCRDQGLAAAAAQSWPRSGEQVESHLRAALRERIGDS